MLTTDTFKTTLFFPIMSSANIVLKCAFEKVFTGSTKITKAIHSCLKAKILQLPEVCMLSWSIDCFATKLWSKAKLLWKLTCRRKGFCLLRRADIAQKKDWKIVTDSGTTWRSYQNEVKDFRNKVYVSSPTQYI